MPESQIYGKLLSLSRKVETITSLAKESTLARSVDYGDIWYFVKQNGILQYAYFSRNLTVYVVWSKTLPDAVINSLPVAYLKNKAAICNSFTNWLEEEYHRVQYIVRL